MGRELISPKGMDGQKLRTRKMWRMLMRKLWKRRTRKVWKVREMRMEKVWRMGMRKLQAKRMSRESMRGGEIESGRFTMRARMKLMMRNMRTREMRTEEMKIRKMMRSRKV